MSISGIAAETICEEMGIRDVDRMKVLIAEHTCADELYDALRGLRSSYCAVKEMVGDDDSHVVGALEKFNTNALSLIQKFYTARSVTPRKL